MQNKFLKNNIVYLTSIALGGFLGYLFHFTLSHQLSVGQYGEFQTVISLNMILGVVFSAVSYFIIKQSAVFALHHDRDGQAHFLSYVMKKFRYLVLFFSVLFLLFLPVIKNVLRLEDYWGIIAIGFSIAIGFYYSFYSNSLQGWNDFVGLSIIGLAIVSIKVASGYLLVVFFPTASVGIWSLVIAAVFGWLITERYFRKKWPMLKNKKVDMQWREKYFSGLNFRKSLMQIMLFSLGLAIVSNVDILIVKNVASAEVAGYYGALSVLGKIVLWLNFSIISVLFPSACAAGYSDQPVQIKTITGSYGFIFLISIPILIAYYFWADFFVRLLFGQPYLVVSANLWLFGVMAFVLSLLTLEANLALARHDYFPSSCLLFLTALILIFSVALLHTDIRAIILAITISFFSGWVMMLLLNLRHRFKSKKQTVRL